MLLGLLYSNMETANKAANIIIIIIIIELE